MRPEKSHYYMNIAAEVAKRSTCLRRQYGAVIVKDDVIVSTGYNGACRGEANCCDLGICERQRLGVPHGERYELCKAVHAEQNAIINGNRSDMIGADLYVFGWQDGKPIDTECCLMCQRIIRNARIGRVLKNQPSTGTIAAVVLP